MYSFGIGKPLFSLMLVFALAMSNIQVTPNMNSIIWAAESSVNEAEENTKKKSTDTSDESTARETSEIAQSSETDSKDKSEETEEKVSETSAQETERAETEESSKTQETQEEIETSENEKTEKSTESDSSEETEEDSQIEKTTETVETNTTEEEETTEEVDDKLLNEGDDTNSDNSNISEQVTITVHFKNSNNWQQVKAWYGNADWSEMNGEFPGDLVVDRDENGYYTIITEKERSKGFVCIFNNGSGGEENQTADIKIEASDIGDSDTFEVWVWGNKNNTVISTIDSPIVKDTTVTFYYQNDSAISVKVAGSMTQWGDNAIEMQKDSKGTFFCEVSLDPGEYTYKFIVVEILGHIRLQAGIAHLTVLR